MSLHRQLEVRNQLEALEKKMNKLRATYEKGDRATISKYDVVDLVLLLGEIVVRMLVTETAGV